MSQSSPDPNLQQPLPNQNLQQNVEGSTVGGIQGVYGNNNIQIHGSGNYVSLDGQTYSKEITATKFRDEVLQAYFDRACKLLLDEIPITSPHTDLVRRDTALNALRTLTLTVLRQLDEDGERKRDVIEFLSHAGVIGGAVKLNLSSTNLKHAKLDAVQLEGAIFQGAIFDNATLGGANLKGADLECAVLREAYLGGADLSGACLKDARFNYASLRGACLMDASLEHTDLEKADLSLANLKGANLKGANMEDTVLKLAHLEGADLREIINLDPDQIKEKALDWEKARYSPEFRKKLELLPHTPGGDESSRGTP